MERKCEKIRIVLKTLENSTEKAYNHAPARPLIKASGPTPHPYLQKRNGRSAWHNRSWGNVARATLIHKKLRMYVYICMNIYFYSCMCVSASLHECVCVPVWMCVIPHWDWLRRVYLRIYVYTHTHRHTNIHLYSDRDAPIYTDIHIHTHTCKTRNRYAKHTHAIHI